MAVKLTFRDMQRWSVTKLMQALGNEVGQVHVNGEAIFKIRVMTEKDLSSDSQASISEMTRPLTVKLESSPGVYPLYNPAVHKAGEKVLMRQGKRLVLAVVPELDGAGEIMPV